jgi:hypothetical protein
MKTYTISNKKIEKNIKEQEKTLNAFLKVKMRIFSPKNGGNGELFVAV